jgi:16S rRNA (cytosine967-C5)-methyltransferase
MADSRDARGRPPSPERMAALALLGDVRRGSRAEEAFARHAAGLDRRQRHFLMELAYGSIRWRKRLDWHLDALLAEGLASLPFDVAQILELGAYQLLFMDRVPPWSAVDESVALVRAATSPEVARWATGVVNGVLRNMARRRNDLPLPDSADPIRRLAVEHSHPSWLVERWLARFGAEATEALLVHDNEPPRLHLHPNVARATAQTLHERLAAAGIDASLHPLTPEAIVVGSGVAPEELPGWQEGAFWVQDAGAQWVVRAAPPPPGTTILDVCAAPGGKLAALLARMERSAGREPPPLAFAVDRDAERLERVGANAARLGFARLALATADARALPTRRSFDYVLADVPCTGTGVLRRRVDARWRRRPEDVGRFAALQREILSAAADRVRAGGTLVYATCSLESEENEGVVEPFLAERTEFRPAPLDDAVPAALRDGLYLFTRPWRHDMDGMFAARLVRAA